MSQINEILDLISEVDVETKTQTPIVYDVTTPAENIKGTPARLVFPLQLDTTEGRAMTRQSLGRTLTVRWLIVDMMLFKPVTNRALTSVLPELVTYAGNYAQAFRDHMTLKSGVTVEQIDYDWGRYAFPPETDNVYYGCMMTLEVIEIIQ